MPTRPRHSPSLSPRGRTLQGGTTQRLAQVIVIVVIGLSLVLPAVSVAFNIAQTLANTQLTPATPTHTPTTPTTPTTTTPIPDDQGGDAQGRPQTKQAKTPGSLAQPSLSTPIPMAAADFAQQGSFWSLARPDLNLLGTSLFYAALIATLATAMGYPVACVLGRVSGKWLLIAATPMLMPTYLAYAGWSILRAPTTPLGRFIGSAPEHGLAWVPGLVGRGLAVWSLSLWVWPLAAVIVGMGIRSLGPAIHDSLLLDAPTTRQRVWAQLRAVRMSLGLAWLLIVLVMLGSAVPLHVAQIQTYAIHVWVVLDANLSSPWHAWIVAWPVVVIALIAGWVIAGPAQQAARVLRKNQTNNSIRQSQPRFWTWSNLRSLGLAAMPWVFGVGVPFGLFVWAMGSARALVRFFHDAQAALLNSSEVALAVGAVSAVLCLAAGQLALGTGNHGSGSESSAGGRSQGQPPNRLLKFALIASLAWALLPGVLPGSAVAILVRSSLVPGVIEKTVLPMILAHVSRFAFLPLLVGSWLGTTGLGGVQELRLLDGADTLGGWFKTVLPLQLGSALAVGLAAGALSFHEIEASVQVQTPGLDHLAQRLLQWLHYERTTELSAAATFLLGLGIVVGLAVVLLSWRRQYRTHN